MGTKRLKSLREIRAEPDYIIVQLPKGLVKQELLLNEGKWMPSSKSGWMQRVDAENPAIPTQRHVHVARTKHTSSKTMQAAWNADGSRHDKSTFNQGVGSLSAARSVARAALGLSDDVVLEKLEEPERKLLLEQNQVYQDAPVGSVALKVPSDAPKYR